MVDSFYELRHDYCAGSLRPVTAHSFIGNRKLTKEEGEDSVVVKRQEGYAIEIIWKYYSF